MPDAIVLRGLTKTFGDTVAVRDLDLVVPQGALYGVIGPNGAGKTTTIRMILSILMPDRGDLSVLGHAVGDGGQGPHRLPAGGARPLQAHARRPVPGVHGAPEERRRAGSRDARDAVARPGRPRRRSRTSAARNCRRACSRRCSSSRPSSTGPTCIILDEPFSGLDPVNQRLLRDLVREEHRRGATVLFSTHVMVHAEQLCDHVVMIHRGAKVLDDAIGDDPGAVRPAQPAVRAARPAADVGALASVAGRRARAQGRRRRGTSRWRRRRGRRR